MIIVKTISSRKPSIREFGYKLISTANIVHTYFSLLILSVYSYDLYGFELVNRQLQGAGKHLYTHLIGKLVDLMELHRGRPEESHCTLGFLLLILLVMLRHQGFGVAVQLVKKHVGLD